MCFDAYFQEAVHEKREEQYRIRRYVIFRFKTQSLWLEKIRRQESTIKNTSGASSDINGTLQIALERLEALKCGRHDYKYMNNVEKYLK